MKFLIPTLTIGQMVRGQVHEIQYDRSLIINFRGDLVRVINDTHRSFSLGQWVVLRVTDTKPLKFQLFMGRKSFLNLLKVEA